MNPQEDPRLTATWKKTIRVAVSGAAGQISNHLLFMVGSRRAPVSGVAGITRLN